MPQCLYNESFDMEYFLPLFLNWKNPLATYAEKEYIHLPCCLLEQLCLDLRKLNIFLNADICKKTFFFFSYLWKAMPDVKQWITQYMWRLIGIIGKIILMGDLGFYGSPGRNWRTPLVVVLYCKIKGELLTLALITLSFSLVTLNIYSTK